MLFSMKVGSCGKSCTASTSTTWSGPETCPLSSLGYPAGSQQSGKKYGSQCPRLQFVSYGYIIFFSRVQYFPQADKIFLRYLIFSLGQILHPGSPAVSQQSNILKMLLKIYFLDTLYPSFKVYNYQFQIIEFFSDFNSHFLIKLD